MEVFVANLSLHCTSVKGGTIWLRSSEGSSISGLGFFFLKGLAAWLVHCWMNKGILPERFQVVKGQSTENHWKKSSHISGDGEREISGDRGLNSQNSLCLHSVFAL